MNFDLANLDTKTKANEGFEFEVIHPVTQEGTGFMITVLGEDSDVHRSATVDNQRRRLKKTVKRGVDITDIPLEELEDDALQVLALCTVRWRMKDDSPVEYKGAPFPCSSANAALLYEEVPVIRQQAEQAIRNRANFTARSA